MSDWTWLGGGWGKDQVGEGREVVHGGWCVEWG